MDYSFSPIGYLHSEQKYRYETPRQGVLAGDTISVIKLNPQNNFEQAVIELNGFERIWVIYLFHLNTNWKPMVTPPRHTRKKIGVFATRSPHRPNNIGMSCVKLEKVDGLNIYISQSDILDGSPIVDIKPYLPYSDSFPNVKTGWVKPDFENKYTVIYSPLAESQMAWLKETANINLKNFAKLQLEFKPTDTSRKRISEDIIDKKTIYTLAYRTWRILFTVNDTEKQIKIFKITTGYTLDELNNLLEDKYSDKLIHLKFNKNFT
ncbi:MAG: tRNA (N6-threonylcarbamoyladenosine(37)-N6)-methyltransferase TrmO [bacterium]